MMQAVILYDTDYGATEQLAETIGTVLEQRYEVRFVRARAHREITERPDLLLVGSPTRRRKPTSAILSALRQLPDFVLDHVACSAFSTHNHRIRVVSGAAALEIARRLSQRDARVELRPESFFVSARDGQLAPTEIERATRWAEQVMYLVTPNPPARFEPGF